MLVCMQKINFITHFFLKILKRNGKLVILGNLSMPGHTPKMVVSVWGNIRHLSAGKKSTSSFTFSLSYFLLQRYCKLVLGTLDMPGYAHPKWYYQFIENFCVYLQAQKINFIPHAFLKIGWQHFGQQIENQNFVKYGIGAEISTTILAFILDYFQEKRFRFLINFLKSSKKILVKNGQKWFFMEKRPLPVFKYSNYLPIIY